MNLPQIFEDTCPTPGAQCTDPRCQDPVFAAANPDICNPGGLLVLHPDFVTACVPTDMQFEAFLETPDSEIPLLAGVQFSSSNPSALIIDASSGAATAIAAGIVTVTATWQDLTAYAQVNILGTDGTCCDTVQVVTAIALDNSASMGQPYGPGYASKLAAARAVLEPFVEDLLPKDEDGVLWFNASSGVQVAPTSFPSNVAEAISAIPQSSGDTDIPDAFAAAVTVAGAASATRIPVALIVSDGQNVESLTTQQRSDLLAAAHAFKTSGGLVICVGIRAYGDGYTLLRSMANGGFFWNVFGDAAAVATAAAGLQCSLGYFCAGSHPPGGYGYGCAGYTCCDQPTAAQYPDPDPQCDVEGGPCPPPPALPRLPQVVMTPSSGTVTPGFTVALSVPSHPNAAIRFATQAVTPPVDPAFSGPGTDYDGPNRPVSIDPPPTGQTVYLKAVAREAGYLDSLVSGAGYGPPSGPGQISGLLWKMPCLAPLFGGGCACHDPQDQVITLTGDPAILYDVTLRFRGVVELNQSYTGGTLTPATSFYTGGAGSGSANQYTLQVSNPAQIYFLNSGTFRVAAIDYTVTIQMQGNATVTLSARSEDNAQAANNSQLVVGGDPPVSVQQPYNGQFLEVTVLSVTPH